MEDTLAPLQDIPETLVPKLDVHISNPDVTASGIRAFCAALIDRGNHGLCIPGNRVLLAASLLENTAIVVIGQVGGPYGQSDPEVKRFETESVIDLGAQEIELTVNSGQVLDGSDKILLRELRDGVEAAEIVPVWARVQTRVLDEDTLRRAVSLFVEAGCRGVTLDILSPQRDSPLINLDPTIEAQIVKVREWVGPKMGIKLLLPGFAFTQTQTNEYLRWDVTRIGFALG